MLILFDGMARLISRSCNGSNWHYLNTKRRFSDNVVSDVLNLTALCSVAQKARQLGGWTLDMGHWALRTLATGHSEFVALILRLECARACTSDSATTRCLHCYFPLWPLPVMATSRYVDCLFPKAATLKLLVTFFILLPKAEQIRPTKSNGPAWYRPYSAIQPTRHQRKNLPSQLDRGLPEIFGPAYFSSKLKGPFCRLGV